MLSVSNTEMSIHTFMPSRLDYCNASLGGCSARWFNMQQLEFLLEPGSMTTLTWFGQHCTSSLLNIV